MSRLTLSPSAILFSLSAILTVIAVGSYGWFYVSYPKYEGSYGVSMSKDAAPPFVSREHAWY
ncbi:hypothetical protein BC830DRAFT_1169489 [Chytriomyces sp. MP71]|nr:hypothetical protein BC830DRAFT_1169489 [Chytriomyces sp. MP71]